MKIPKVGDVLRLTLADDAHRTLVGLIERNGNTVVVTKVKSNHYLNMVDLELKSAVTGKRMSWERGDYEIPLFESEFTIEPLLTAVYKRKHGHPKSR